MIYLPEWIRLCFTNVEEVVKEAEHVPQVYG